MKVWHRILLADTPQRREALSSLGSKFGTPDSSLVRVLWFDIAEDDTSWCQVLALVMEWNGEDGCDLNNLGMVHTEFSRE